ncbi:hypothetical protein [Flavobacterium cyclinae]|uniref:hypothetical protein n=1 Tax=Flavobacterium cyclinae TaxID=2895947 RepID=UPI001E30DF05|nr:hypothetical protein [Flavobacterium cyclinae]UGS22317.1 hypothetical protein LOS86_06755 [Flavobacterium cyclinae]
MENKKQLLDQLKKRNEELNPLVFKSFKTEKELNNYTKKNQEKIYEYYDNQEKIEILEWELMTPEEKKTKQELLEKMKLKRDGKL